MDIDDKDFYLVRKNLNTFSVLILVLAFTNAEIDILNFLGVEIKLDGQKFYIALFAIYVYLSWRYFTKLPLRSGFWNDFSTYYMNSYGGENSLVLFQKYKGSFVTDPPEKGPILDEVSKYQLTKISSYRLSGGTFLKLRLVASLYIMEETNGLKAGNNLSANCDIILSRASFLRKFLLFCVKYDKFGDYIFPIIPIVVNLLFFVTKSEWQGSFWSILG